MQESDCLEQRLWHGSICVVVLVCRRAQLRHNLGKVWEVLQATVKWSESPLWSSHKLYTWQQECRWVVQCSTSSSHPVKIPQETAKILYRDIFLFILHDEDFVSKAINEGNVDLDKLPESKVRQLTSKMESSKATVHHIMQVVGDPQAAHQNKERCLKCGDSTHVEGFQCPAKSSNVKDVTSFYTLPIFVIIKSKLHSSQRSQRHINYKQRQYMQKEVPYVVNLKITAQVRIPFTCRSKCSTHKLISRRFPSQPTL